MLLRSEEKELRLTSREEEESVKRSLLIWINKCPLLPRDIDKGLVQYDMLPKTGAGMALHTIQGASILENYITGGHTASYQFSLIYRANQVSSSNKRLTAEETLDKIAAWLVENVPDLGDKLINVEVKQNTRSAQYAPYEDGDADFQTMMSLTYEVL